MSEMKIDLAEIEHLGNRFVYDREISALVRAVRAARRVAAAQHYDVYSEAMEDLRTDLEGFVDSSPNSTK